MVSAKKARGRLQRAQRTARPNAKPERYAPSRLTDDMHRHYEPDFVPIRITKEMRGYAGAQLMLLGVEEGALVLEKVKDQEFGFGWNAATDNYGDLLELGVIDPSTVTMQVA